jgi:hypothetical protein
MLLLIHLVHRIRLWLDSPLGLNIMHRNDVIFYQKFFTRLKNGLRLDDKVHPSVIERHQLNHSSDLHKLQYTRQQNFFSARVGFVKISHFLLESTNQLLPTFSTFPAPFWWNSVKTIFTPPPWEIESKIGEERHTLITGINKILSVFSVLLSDFHEVQRWKCSQLVMQWRPSSKSAQGSLPFA